MIACQKKADRTPMLRKRNPIAAAGRVPVLINECLSDALANMG